MGWKRYIRFLKHRCTFEFCSTGRYCPRYLFSCETCRSLPRSGWLWLTRFPRVQNYPNYRPQYFLSDLTVSTLVAANDGDMKNQFGSPRHPGSGRFERLGSNVIEWPKLRPWWRTGYYPMRQTSTSSLLRPPEQRGLKTRCVKFLFIASGKWDIGVSSIQRQLSSSNSNSKKAGNMKLLFGFHALILVILSDSLLSPDSHHSAQDLQTSCNWPGTHLVVPGAVWYRLSSRLIPNAWVNLSQNKIQSHQDISWHSDFWACQFEMMPGNIISKSVTPGRSQPKVVSFIQVAQPALLHVSWPTLLVFPLTHA